MVAPDAAAVEANIAQSALINRDCARLLHGRKFDLILIFLYGRGFRRAWRAAPAAQFPPTLQRSRSPDQRAGQRNLPPYISPHCIRNSGRGGSRRARLSVRAGRSEERRV